MKILVIPDVHGRSFWRVAKERYDEFDRIVFLGDYLDPYLDEGDGIDSTIKGENVTPETAIAMFEEIIDFAKGNDKVTLLLGNHDLSYFTVFNCRVRHIYEYQSDINNMFIKNLDLFKLGTYQTIGEKTYLFTHAGMMNNWLESFMGEREERDTTVIDYINDEFKAGSKKLLNFLDYYSKHRGMWGRDMASIVWADIRDHMDEKEYAFPDNYVQIIGHTRLKARYIDIEDRIVCLDSRQPFMIDDEGIKFMNGELVKPNYNKNK